MHEVIALELSRRREMIEEYEGRARAFDHCDGHCAVERYNRRRLDALQLGVELGNARPISLLCVGRPAMHGCDLGLENEWSDLPAARLLDQRQGFLNLRP